MREQACSGLSGLGIELDPALNAESPPIISTSTAACQVRVVPTNEDLVIARSAAAVRRASADALSAQVLDDP